MSTYRIFTDATSDLPRSFAQETGVTVLPMHVTLGTEELVYNPAEPSFDVNEFFERMRNGEPATTAQINAYEFTEAFKPVLEAGEDIIYIAFSDKLSSMYASSKTAQAELAEKYPERRVTCINSKSESLGQGLLVYYAARQHDKLSYDEMVEWIEANKLNFVHWFTVDDLVYLKRGGRISGATAAIGTVLQIKPIMHTDEEGYLIAVDKIMGRKKSLKQLAENAAATFNKEKCDLVFIGNCGAKKDAEYAAGILTELTGCTNIYIDHIGPIIGAHSGPGTVSIFTYGKRGLVK